MRHRVFLSTLVVASKYLNDSTLKNEHWSKCSSFRIRDITVMETEVLSLLDYDLRFTEEEACEMFAPLMATYAQRASMRALAVDRVVKAGRARVQAQQITEPSVESNSRPSLPRVSSTSSDLSSTACTLSEQLSSMHLSQSTASSPMYSTLSTGSTISTSSSDVGSLIDDTGSSSGSSSGWNSSDSESETEEQIEPQVYSNSSLDLRSHGDSARLVKPSSFVRSVPSYTQKNYQLRERSRKPSDTSSIRTITQSPLMSVHSRRCSAKRSTSISHAVAYNKGSSISSSATMPSISRGTSGNFLSRMWGAAKGQALGQDKTDCGDYTDGQGSSALRRLTLHTRPSFSRGLSNSNVDVVWGGIIIKTYSHIWRFSLMTLTPLEDTPFSFLHESVCVQGHYLSLFFRFLLTWSSHWAARATLFDYWTDAVLFIARPHYYNITHSLSHITIQHLYLPTLLYLPSLKLSCKSPTMCNTFKLQWIYVGIILVWFKGDVCWFEVGGTTETEWSLGMTFKIHPNCRSQALALQHRSNFSFSGFVLQI